MYDFCCQLKHLLVGILFHNLHHPYIPLHFEEMIFPLVPLIFLAHSQPHPFRAAERGGGAAARYVYDANARTMLWVSRARCGLSRITRVTS